MTIDPEPGAPNPYPEPVEAACPEPVEGMRTFTLNSPEAYEALCPREDRPWIPNGALPREPRSVEREVVVEAAAWRRGR
jgi:hypothetical protein